MRTNMVPKTESKKTPAGEARFEEALAELEGVVRRLEQGELPLEDSLADFERGMGLVKQLSKRLEDIERRVEVLLAQEGGGLATKPFDDGTEG
jgi:exodeoxyribonuclease VII small subunit